MKSLNLQLIFIDMKLLLAVFTTLVFFATSCDQNAKFTKSEVPATAGVISATEPPPATTIQWIDSARNVGKITEGEKVEISFRFKNTGDKQLVIQNVTASCGCTVAEKPDQPVSPGEEGIIKAAFDSKGRLGTNHKTITVYANTVPASHTVAFDVEVEKKN